MPPQNASPSGDSANDARDVALMLRVQNGDTEAFRELIEAHQYRVAAVIARMAGPASDPEELAHEVFVRVWKAAPRYEPTARFTTWLMAITRNLVLNELRSRARHPTVPFPSGSDPEEPGETAHPDTVSGRPDQILQQNELETAIDRALQQLPENQRSALIFQRYEDLSYEEIAAALEVSVPSVKSLLFRARTTLRETLREFLE